MRPVRRNIAAALAAGCTVAMLVGCGTYESGGASGHDSGGASGAEEAAPAEAEAGGGLLMVHEARRARLVARGGDGEYRLTLRSPSPFVTVFSDRPERRAYRVDADRFVESWAAYGFEDDPPNAALEAADAPPGQDLMIVELSDPALDDSGRITYTARQGSEQSSHKAAFQREADDLTDATIERPMLFIDSGSPDPAGWSQACSMERGSSNTSGYIWHCTWPNKQSKPSDALNVLASKCPGSFNYDQNRDASCIS
ncbi:MAG: hypothetical protein WAL70_06685 [Aeromicrobium sp.]